MITVALMCAAGAGMANALVALGSKAAERQRCRPDRFGAVALGAACVVCLGVALVRRGAWGDGWLWLLGLVMGGLFYAALCSILAANRSSPPSLVWSLANLALVLPIVLSAMLLGETLQPVDALIFVVFVGMLATLTAGAKAAEIPHTGVAEPSEAVDVRRARRWGLLAVVFATNGLLMFGFKLHHRYLPLAEPACLTTIMYAAGAALALADQLRRRLACSPAARSAGWWWLGLRRRGRGSAPASPPVSPAVAGSRCKPPVDAASSGASDRLTGGEWRCGLGVGAATGAAVLLLVHAMPLPAAVAFPVIQGISLLGGITLTTMVYRERINLLKVTGIALGLAVIALAVAR